MRTAKPAGSSADPQSTWPQPAPSRCSRAGRCLQRALAAGATAAKARRLAPQYRPGHGAAPGAVKAPGFADRSAAAQALACDELHVNGNVGGPAPSSAKARARRAQLVGAPLAGMHSMRRSWSSFAACRRWQSWHQTRRRWPAAQSGFTSARPFKVWVSAFIWRVSLQRVVYQEVRAFSLHLAHQPIVAGQHFKHEARNCLSRMRGLCSAPEMANSFEAMRQFSNCQVWLALRRHTLTQLMRVKARHH